jgi:hypothetical protein
MLTLPFDSFFWSVIWLAHTDDPVTCVLTMYLYWNVVPDGMLTVAFQTGYEDEDNAICTLH